MKDIKVTVRISSFQSGGPPYNGFDIVVIDDNSRVALCDIRLTHEQLGSLLGARIVEGLPCRTAVRDPRVGMRRVRESRSIVAPFRSYDREVCAEWLRANVALKHGEYLDDYLGSRGSIKTSYDDQTTTINYAVYWYEDV